MDVGMLFDMDNLETTILPASYNSTGRTPTSSNDNSPSKGRDIPRTPRAHLHPMTNIDEPPHDQGLWHRNAHIQPHKQWSHLREGHLSSHQNSKPRSTNQLCAAPSLQYQDRPSCPPVSFPVLQEPYEIKSTPNSSPAQAREDLQWQMYLTASLSNPLNTLEFPDSNSSPLSYSTGGQEHYGANTSLHIDSALFPASNSSTFSLDQVPDLFSTPSFVEVPQMPSGLSSPHNIAASHSHHSFSGFCLPQQQEMPREDPNGPVILPNGCYASFLGLAPLENYDMNSALFVSPSQCQNTAPIMISSPHVSSSPSRGLSEAFVPTSPNHNRGRRGLSGWNSDYQLKVPPATTVPLPTPHTSKRRRSASASPSTNLRHAYQASPLPATTTAEMISSSHQSKRRRPPPPQVRHFVTEEEEEDGEANNVVDDSDSDDYRPSRSPTPVNPSDPFGLGRGFSLELSKHRLVPPTPTKKMSRRGKGKAKGSAALALAVVTQLGSKGIQARSRGGGAAADQHGVDNEEFDAMALYQEGRTGIRKRKNNPIPLPIPIPNLNKKSRGRKVPFVADLSADGIRRSASVLSVDSIAKSEVPDEAGVQLSLTNGNGSGTATTGFAQRSSGRAKGLKRGGGGSNPNPAPVVDDAGCRTYVCVIPGCGKCFVRGEHLKRHVRSIHTHDKPHPCPYEGCDKTFSRRDNLGQHVRIHLQP